MISVFVSSILPNLYLYRKNLNQNDWYKSTNFVKNSNVEYLISRKYLYNISQVINPSFNEKFLEKTKEIAAFPDKYPTAFYHLFD